MEAGVRSGRKGTKTIAPNGWRSMCKGLYSTNVRSFRCLVCNRKVDGNNDDGKRGRSLEVGGFEGHKEK